MPRPVLQAMVLADHVYQDRATGKCIIAGTFSMLQVRKQKVAPSAPDRQTEIEGEHRSILGPVTRSGSPYLYIALSEVHGTIPLRVRLVKLIDYSVVMEGDFQVASRDPVLVNEYIVPLPDLPQEPAPYSLDLLHEGEILGSWRIAVTIQEDESERGR